MTKLHAIAIDGPVAAGKTVVGKLVAARLGLRFLDTGIMYRAIAWAAVTCGLDIEDETKLGKLARSVKIELVSEDGGKDRLLLDGKDITSQLRTAEVEKTVSLVAKVDQVRRALVEKQKAIGKEGGIVMVGRDIGTVVLPNAKVKIFLSASVEERAKRRFLEMGQKGGEGTYRQILDGLRRRDKIDTERLHSPLKAADDAVVINTDGMEISQVVESITSIVRGKGWELHTQ